MDVFRRAACVLLAIAPAVGCANNPCGPEPLGLQRARAQAFDPYPDADMGPEIVGGRPRDYQEQLPEPLRARVPSRAIDARRARVGY